MSDTNHWEEIYRAKSPDDVSWYRPHLDTSLALLDEANISEDTALVDVGAGASTLIDDLLERGLVTLYAIDLSEAALAATKQRLGDRASSVEWIVGDVRETLLPPDSVDVWHDRAVFHFLTKVDDREAYLSHLRTALRPGGHVLIATFGPDGPERCSGLPVVRYTADEIATSLGAEFRLVASTREEHETPWGTKQAFTYTLCRQGK